jgi:hypothetical protein
MAAGKRLLELCRIVCRSSGEKTIRAAGTRRSVTRTPVSYRREVSTVTTF